MEKNFELFVEFLISTIISFSVVVGIIILFPDYYREAIFLGILVSVLVTNLALITAREENKIYEIEIAISVFLGGILGITLALLVGLSF
jgi:putative effector of murein hydrolase